MHYNAYVFGTKFGSGNGINTYQNMKHRKDAAVLQIMEQCKRIGILEKITQIQVKDEYVITLDSDEIKINLGDATNLKNRFDYVNALLKQEKDNKGTLYVNGNLNEGFLPYFYAE